MKVTEIDYFIPRRASKWARRAFAGPAALLCIITLSAAATSVLLAWERQAPTVNPVRNARAVAHDRDAQLATDAVIVVLRDVRESIASLKRAGRRDDAAGMQARLALEQIERLARTK